MKNIFVLPTKAISKLQMKMDNTLHFDDGVTSIALKSNQHIYVTTNDEPVEDGDWYLATLFSMQGSELVPTQFIVGNKPCAEIPLGHKIVLTTDENLIGVQCLTDKFVQWYVNNPCDTLPVAQINEGVYLPLIIDEKKVVKASFDVVLQAGDYVDVQMAGVHQIYERDGELYFTPYGHEDKVREYFSSDLIKVDAPKKTNLKTSKEWQEIATDVIIIDHDGWDRANFKYSWEEELITFKEYYRRRLYSTTQLRKEEKPLSFSCSCMRYEAGCISANCRNCGMPPKQSSIMTSYKPEHEPVDLISGNVTNGIESLSSKTYIREDKGNMISEWLDRHGDPEIEKQVEEEGKQMFIEIEAKKYVEECQYDLLEYGEGGEVFLDKEMVVQKLSDFYNKMEKELKSRNI